MSDHRHIPEDVLRDKIRELEYLIETCDGYGSNPNMKDPFIHQSHSDSHDYCHIRIEWRNWLLALLSEF